ncbi:MAG TPA: Crp/Fnr family transcriptional regulator [Thermoanaerobaculia bacterium]|nr:Crp/Fnr family transcriptional regulator [Thermoanaerobaculia bacterium]
MHIYNVTRLLGEMELFRDLLPEQILEMEALMARRTFPGGTLLMSVEQPGSALFIILEGSVKVFLNRDDGSEVIVSLLGSGHTVGEMSVFLGSQRCANAVTMERTAMLCMSGGDFETFLKRLPQLSFNVGRQLSLRLRLANQQILALSSLDVAGRVAREILAFAERFGRDEDRGWIRIPLRLTQGDLASIIGTSRERVNQVMVRFKRRGYLSVDRAHHITVHNREELARRCGWGLAQTPSLVPG